MKLIHKRLISILLLFIISLFIALPRHIQVNISLFGASINQTITLPSLNIQLGNFSFQRNFDLKLGLDLAGGSHLVFETDMSKIPAEDYEPAMEGTRATIERRVNLFGVSESLVQTSKVGESYRIVVDLPGVKDTRQAINLIGQTARLEFKEVNEIKENEATEPATLLEFIETDLGGADLIRSRVEFSPETGSPVIALQFKEAGTKKFSEITKRNVGKVLAIVLDDQVLMMPVVQQEINDGNSVITGNFTLDQVKEIVIQLNSGALPTPINLIEQRTIEASLGTETIRTSVFAGAVGLLMVMLFMILYYGRLGFLASVALLFYGILTLAIYKLVPVVLTLPGVAGFILSIGMAVDSNILIFERMKEELKAGRHPLDAMEAGFGRAWDSIRDASGATLLIVFILFNPFNFEFLHTSGPIRGFALTLGFGVLVSLFTGVFVTRTLLRLFAKSKNK